MSNEPTFYWYDLETFGTESKYHRIAQFAGVRTDQALNIIEEPLVMYNRPSSDFLPDPMSCLITGISPQMTLEKGLPESVFVRNILDKFSVPNTCVVGYNNIRFDDEFMRYAFYRNLLDPYEREWKDNNSRWDIIDMVRATYALRPEGIQWPVRDMGLPSFRLEDLTVANGIPHERAHDAYSDVLATINMAKLIKEKQPKLYDFVLNHRDKHAAAKYLDTARRPAVAHISGMYKSENGCMAVVMPVAKHPINKNGTIVIDLSYDPSQLDKMSVREIHDLIYTANEDLPDGAARIPVKTVHLNRCPIIVPINVLTDDICKQYHLDLHRCYQHRDSILNNKSIADKLRKVFAEKRDYGVQDVDECLYNGFFSGDDKEKMADIRTRDTAALKDFVMPFNDPRLPELVFRYRARNFPETLNADELARWNEHRLTRLRGEAGDVPLTLQAFAQKLSELRSNSEITAAEIVILDQLSAYVESVAA